MIFIFVLLYERDYMHEPLLWSRFKSHVLWFASATTVTLVLYQFIPNRVG